MDDPASILEQAAGVALFLAIGADVFLTVLYARIGSRGVAKLGAGWISIFIARAARAVFHAAARNSRHRDGILSFYGPLALVGMAMAWAFGFAIAAALVLHPHLGTTIRTQGGDTPTDFLAALYAGGTSLAITGSSEFLPTSDAMRVFYLITSVVGTSMVTLAVTYILQVYTGLQLRNTFALELELYTDEEADAAQLIVALAPRGELSLGTNNMAQMGQGMTALKEAYHFHPILFYFRSASVRFSPARFLLIAFDTVTLMRTALEEDLAARMGAFAPITQLWQAAMLLADTLEGTFLARPDVPEYHAHEDLRERWRRRYGAAREKLRNAGVAVRADEADGARRYIALREKWQRHIEDLGDYMAFTREEVDPAAHPAHREGGSSPPGHDEAPAR